MRAAVTTAEGSFEVTTLPDPIPAPDEVLIKIAACGVCGSDLKAQPFVPPGTVMGHELAGEIVDVGAAVEEWQPGTQVAVLPVLSCGTCPRCNNGDLAHCADVGFIGMGVPAGGFAELAAVPANRVFRLPTGLSGLDGALVEPLAVGLHGARRGGVAAHDSVLVIGAGGVGLTTATWCRALGADRVTVADPSELRREVALRAGATDVIVSSDLAEPDAYDVVIECVGKPELLEHCEAASRSLGTIVLAGACDAVTPLEPIAGLLKELTVRFSVAYRPDDFAAVVAALESGTIDPRPLAGPELGLGKVPDAFALVAEATTEGRVMVVPSRVE